MGTNPAHHYNRYTSRDAQVQLRVSKQWKIPVSPLRLLSDDDDDGISGGRGARFAEYILQNSTIAASAESKYLAVGYGNRFVLFGRPSPDSVNIFSDDKAAAGGGAEGSLSLPHLQLVSVGSDAADQDELITSLCCLPIFSPRGGKGRSRDPQYNVCVAVGYNTGYLRIFSINGHLLTAHQLHSSPLIRIRLRTPASLSPSSPEESPSDLEELCLTYSDGTLVCIDGQSMYLALRQFISDPSPGSSTPAPSDSAFSYKKWAFSSGPVADAAAYGPSNCPVLLGIGTTTAASGIATTSNRIVPQTSLLPNATARFLVVSLGDQSSMLAVHTTNEDARVSFSAVDLAGRMAARVTGAVLSLAKAYLWRSDSALRTNTPTPSSSPPALFASDNEPAATFVPKTVEINDGVRRVLDISLSPPRYQLAALRDSLGRVTVFDLESAECTGMLKGLRGCQCAWIERILGGGNTVYRRLFIAVYITKRGVLEVFDSTGITSVASANVGLGWSLVQCPGSPLGSSLVAANARYLSETVAADIAVLPCVPVDCLLVDTHGTVATIDINFSK